jgi:ribosome-binding factor A
MTPGKRVDRLRDQIRKVVSNVIQTKVKDPHLGFVTVTEVELTKDLQAATVFYSIYGDEEAKRKSQAALQKARGFIQSELGREIRVRKVPVLEFQLDESTERGLRIQELLDRIDREGSSDESN